MTLHPSDPRNNQPDYYCDWHPDAAYVDRAARIDRWAEQIESDVIESKFSNDTAEDKIDR